MSTNQNGKVSCGLTGTLNCRINIHVCSLLTLVCGQLSGLRL